MNKIRVKIIAGEQKKDNNDSYICRQLPASPNHKWNQKYEFYINDDTQECDYFVCLTLFFLLKKIYSKASFE